MLLESLKLFKKREYCTYKWRIHIENLYMDYSEELVLKGEIYIYLD